MTLNEARWYLIEQNEMDRFNEWNNEVVKQSNDWIQFMK